MPNLTVHCTDSQVFILSFPASKNVGKKLIYPMWENELHCGDCIEIMARMPKEHVDLVVTSPPYDDLRTYAAGQNGFDVGGVAWGLWRVLKAGGVVVWVTSDRTNKGSESLTSFEHAFGFRRAGFNIHDTMIYAKNNPIPQNRNRYEQAFEFMFVFSKGPPRIFNPLRVPITSPRPIQEDVHHTTNYRRGSKKRGHNSTKIKNNIWNYNIGLHCSTKDKEAFKHPAIFPEQLATDHVLSWTNPGDLVFDPMCGSGTTLKAAKQYGRRYLGCDVCDEYLNIARQRLSRV